MVHHPEDGDSEIQHNADQQKSNCIHQYVFCFKDERLRKDLVNLVNHGKDIRQMEWASIWLGGRSNLVIMERDEFSPKKRLYREILS